MYPTGCSYLSKVWTSLQAKSLLVFVNAFSTQPEPVFAEDSEEDEEAEKEPEWKKRKIWSNSSSFYTGWLTGWPDSNLTTRFEDQHRTQSYCQKLFLGASIKDVQSVS